MTEEEEEELPFSERLSGIKKNITFAELEEENSSQLSSSYRPRRKEKFSKKLSEIKENLDNNIFERSEEIEELLDSTPNSSSRSDGIKINDANITKLQNIIENRRCCQMNGRHGDMYCNICGRVIPDKFKSD